MTRFAVPRLSAGFIGFAAVAFATAAEPGTPLPAGGQSLVGPEAVEKSRFPAVDVADQPFDRAFRAEIQRPGQAAWDQQFVAKIDRPIRRGDVLHLRFYGRCVRSTTGQATLGAVFEQNEPPHSKSLDRTVTVGSQWQVVDLPLTAHRDFAAGDSQLCIRLAYAAQTVEVGGIRLIHYGNTVPIADLPRQKPTYDGIEPDAPWRAEAQARIERIRRGDLTVTVTDSAGAPLPGARVRAVLRRHAFGWGTCVSMRLLDQSPDGERYREKMLELFNEAVTENELKWPNITRHQYANSDRLVAWLNQHGIPTRGHCLVWPGQRWLPRHLLDLQDDPGRMRTAIAQHVTQTVSRYRGQLIDWDVINEPYANHLVMDKCGNEVMVEWFKLAHQADPEVRLYINDYEILASGNALGTPHQNHYHDTIRYLLDRGAPLHGIGLQGHFGATPTAPENLWKILDRFAEFGLRIKVTELDINSNDRQFQALYLRDLLTALFSHPAVDSVLQWGFWEGSHWIPTAALFDRDWTIRPHGQVFVDLIKKTWHTDAAVETDGKGVARLRGYLGDYDLTVTAGGTTHQTTVKLAAGGAESTIRLP